jgi:PAS domain S-box-containing protein
MLKNQEHISLSQTSQNLFVSDFSNILSGLWKSTGKDLFPSICQILRQYLNVESVAIASCDASSLRLKLEAFVSKDKIINYPEQKSDNNICQTVSDQVLEDYKSEQYIETNNQIGLLAELFPHVFKNLLQQDTQTDFCQLSWIWENELLAVGFIQISQETEYPVKENVNLLLSMTSSFLHQKRKEKVQKYTQEKLDSILNVTNDAIILVNKDLKITSWNTAAETMFKYSSNEIISKSLFTVLPKEIIEKHSLLLGEVFENQSSIVTKKTIEIIGIRKDKSAFPIELSLKQWNISDKCIYTLVIHDITERKFSEDRMKATINEKVTLLQEIHHRVKNNMQVISSLLYLQGKKIEDEETKEIFNESMNRVRSMSLIHEKLYRSADFINIYYLKDYIKDLVKSLYASYRIDYNKIKFYVHVDDISLYVDFAVPLGLTINELVSNSLKHAFPPSWEGIGEIKISLTLAENGLINFNYKDNGVGIPGDFDINNTRSLGFCLITGFVKEQLGGTINVIRDKGTEFKIVFKKTKHLHP